jgi:hypothetical protein
MPKEIAAPAIVTYLVKDFNTDVNNYRTDMAAKDYASARILRDSVVARALSSIEYGYGKFEGQLITDRAAFQTGADIAALGVTAATTVVPVGDIKDILAATLSAMQGTRLSIDKNFYEQKTSESLISQMRADRKDIEATILNSLATQNVIPVVDPATNKTIPAYGLDDAWRDLLRYYYAGTVPSALVSLTATTGEKAAESEQHLKDVRNSINPATHEQAQQALDIGHGFIKLRNALLGANKQQADLAAQKARNILSAIGKPQSDAATPQELVSALTAAMAEADDDHSKLPALQAAFQQQSIQ